MAFSDGDGSMARIWKIPRPLVECLPQRIVHGSDYAYCEDCGRGWNLVNGRWKVSGDFPCTR